MGMILDYVIRLEDEGRRAGRVAAQAFALSAADLARLKRDNALLLDGTPARQIDRVRPGQRLTVRLPDGAAAGERPDWLVYEDDALRVLDKPSGLATMSDRSGGESLQRLYEARYGVFRPVSRLDKGTGGLLVAARTGYVQHRLADMLHTDRFIREYLALAEGVVRPPEGVIDLPIAHGPEASSLRMTAPGGKPSVTLYRVLRIENGRSLLRLRLLTGRTHQIRVHLAAIGHPICGDYLYGAPWPDRPGRFALHSAYLFLTHPLTGERLFFRSRPDEWAESGG